VEAGVTRRRAGLANATVSSACDSSPAIAVDATFWLGWVDSDASGGDDGLAIDDFSLTPDDRIFNGDFE
jgi:hypothetical protein